MSPAVFKTDTTAPPAVGWVRFPDAPAIIVGAAILAAALVTLGQPPALLAQEPEPPAADQDTVLAVPDSLPAPREPADAGRGEPAQGEPDPDRRRTVNPTGALLRSILIPGWGQVAADQPARGGVYFTVWSGGVFMILKANSELNAAKRAEDEDFIDSRSQAREDWILFTGLWALLSGVDAWVSAHFAGFEGELRPPQDGSPGVEISYPVKLF